VPEAPEKAISQLGDLYQLGQHRLLCGDSTAKDAVDKLMDGQKADMVFTDPPYNVDYGGNNNPKYKSRKIQNDNHTISDWDEFVRGYVARLFENCDGNIFICMSDKELGHLQNTFVELGGRWSSFLIWVKSSLVISQKDYHSRHETILYGWKDGVSGRFRPTDRSLDDIWEFDKPSRSDEHPTMKPVELVEKAIVNGCKKASSVLDLFGGSGSTLIASEKLNRKCYMMELDPQYCDVIVKRFNGLFPEIEILRNGEAFEPIHE
jgi:DNA modification methylase